MYVEENLEKKPRKQNNDKEKVTILLLPLRGPAIYPVVTEHIGQDLDTVSSYRQ